MAPPSSDLFQAGDLALDHVQFLRGAQELRLGFHDLLVRQPQVEQRLTGSHRLALQRPDPRHHARQRRSDLHRRPAGPLDDHRRHRDRPLERAAFDLGQFQPDIFLGRRAQLDGGGLLVLVVGILRRRQGVLLICVAFASVGVRGLASVGIRRASPAWASAASPAWSWPSWPASSAGRVPVHLPNVEAASCLASGSQRLPIANPAITTTRVTSSHHPRLPGSHRFRNRNLITIPIRRKGKSHVQQQLRRTEFIPSKRTEVRSTTKSRI